MGSHYAAKCRRCAYKEEFGDPLRTYTMADGSWVSVQRIFVWCAACRAIRWGECIADLEDLEQELSDTEARHPLISEQLEEQARLEGMLSGSNTKAKNAEELLAD